MFIISNTDLQINEQIRDKEIRLVGENGEQIGVVSAQQALALAEEKGLDLVKIAPTAQPPVCRIMDYGKFKFEIVKREREAKKNQKVVDIKEIRLSPAIDVHDFEVKINHAKRFISDGDKVKVVVRFKGREMSHTEIGNELLERFAEYCKDFAVVEKPPKMDGRQMMMFLTSKK